MHEIWITEQLLSLSLKYALQQRAKRILKISLVLGELSSYIDDSIEYYWQEITKGTMAENAILLINRRKSYFKCRNCNTILKANPAIDTCPQCSSYQLLLQDADQMEIEYIDLEI